MKERESLDSSPEGVESPQAESGRKVLNDS